MPLGNAPITLVGTLGGDPELRQVGAAQVASFSVAVTPRKKEGDQWVDGETTWFRCSAWRELGEHAAASLHKGDRVIVQGTIGERKYEVNGETRSSWEVEVEEIGPSLRYATAGVQRVQRNANQAQRREQFDSQNGGGRYPAGNTPQQRQQPAQQSWSQGGYDDETPF